VGVARSADRPEIAMTVTRLPLVVTADADLLDDLRSW
jgi:hypothetical protein